MAASIAGVFWRAARPSDLAYRHTRRQQRICVLNTRSCCHNRFPRLARCIPRIYGPRHDEDKRTEGADRPRRPRARRLPRQGRPPRAQRLAFSACKTAQHEVRGALVPINPPSVVEPHGRDRVLARGARGPLARRVRPGARRDGRGRRARAAAAALSIEFEGHADDAGAGSDRFWRCRRPHHHRSRRRASSRRRRAP